MRHRLLTLLVAVLLALGGLLVPAGVGPAAAAKTAAGETPQQRAERLVSTATGRRLYDQYERFRLMTASNARRNLNEIYLRGSAFNSKALQALGERAKPSIVKIGVDQNMKPVFGLWAAEILYRSEAPEIFEDLELDASIDSMVVITTLNDPWRDDDSPDTFGAHAEEVAVQELQYVNAEAGMIKFNKYEKGNRVGLRVNRAALQAEALSQTVEFVRDASLAQHGFRYPCASAERHCSLQTEKIESGRVRSVMGKGESGANARIIEKTFEVAKPLREQQKKEVQEKADKAVKGLAVASGEPVKAESQGPACTSMSGGLGGGGVLAASAADCDGQDEKTGVAEKLEKNLGGVDLTSLQLRYVQDSPGSGGMQYAFSAVPADNSGTSSTDGSEAISASAGDLRTWLALDPSTYWVNLSPVEPDRIIHPQMGRTNAGRAMLEADFAMKRTTSRLLDPATDTGRRYWKAMEATGSTCFVSRYWIVPGPVEVREDGDALYILRAPLDVRTEADSLPATDPAACPVASPDITARNEKLERTIVLPEVVKAVNQDPAYAALRRAFTTRVIAQWVRDRHQAGRQTGFDDVLDSGDLGPAALTGTWRPQQVFDAYVKAFRENEYTYTRVTREGRTRMTRSYTTGGVDFANLRLTKIDAERMQKRYPELARDVSRSMNQAATAGDGTLWLGTQVAVERGRWDSFTRRVSDLTASRGGAGLLVLVALAVLGLGLVGGRRLAE